MKVALHVASLGLLERVAAVVAESDDPKSLFEHLSMVFGLGFYGRCGVTRRAQNVWAITVFGIFV